MIITALYANIYQVMLATFASKLSWIKKKLPIEEIYLPIYYRGCQMDQDGKAACA